MDALGRRDEPSQGEEPHGHLRIGQRTRRGSVGPHRRPGAGGGEAGQAAARSSERGAPTRWPDGAATRLLERLLDVGIDGKGPFDSAHTVADQALKNAGGDPDQAIRMIHRQHRRLGLAAGFATGFGGFFTMAIALPANVLEFYLLGTRMTAATARLRGPRRSGRPSCSPSRAPTATTC